VNTKELIVDSFAGGGGASLGIEWATGRSPDIAINHNPAAIAMHKANHPDTRHYAEDVFAVKPKQVARGKKVGLLWLSPDCRHFSRAKGSMPVKKEIRGLAWIAVKWAVEKSPRVIILENVREFQEWGPVVPRWACRSCDWKGTEGQTVLLRKRPTCPRCESRKINPTEEFVPCPKRKGLTFKKFVGRLRNLGYAVEWKVLNAADYGAPTHRRRLFLVARNDGAEIQWPAPTHGDPKKLGQHDLFSEPLKPWRTAAECIDWSIPCPSIFDRKKPLAEKTLRRIALGIKRYVLDNPKPFIVDMQRENRSRSVDEPMGTATTQGNRFNLVTPVITPVTHAGERRSNSVEEPLPTVTGAHRGEQALITPYLVQRYGERPGQDPRATTIEAPIGTVTQTANCGMLVTPHLTKFRTGAVGSAIEEPLPTVTANSYIKRPGGAAPIGLVSACLTQLAHGDSKDGTWNGNSRSTSLESPIGTLHAGGKNHGLVTAFLAKHFGTSIGQAVSDPMHTATAKDRTGLVTVTVDGEPYVITDIGLRMLKPRELARAQGFPDDYILTGTATNQVERIGNSVAPHAACAVAKANLLASEVLS
jgi:DNA (cytosine-5)-methyltransferase 1